MSAFEEFDRSYIDVFVELFSDLEQQTPERDVIGNTRRADSTKVNSIKALELLYAVIRHHFARL